MLSKRQNFLLTLGYCLYHIFIFLHITALLFIVNGFHFGNCEIYYGLRNELETLLSNDNLPLLTEIIIKIAVYLIFASCVVALFLSVFLALPIFYQMYVIWIESYSDEEYYKHLSHTTSQIGARETYHYKRLDYLRRYWPYSVFYQKYINEHTMPIALKLINFVLLLIELRVDQITIQVMLEDIKRALLITNKAIRDDLRESLMLQIANLDENVVVIETIEDLWDIYPLAQEMNIFDLNNNE